jgi:oxygen-independent coproporphyrinogen-3 oxidase
MMTAMTEAPLKQLAQIPEREDGNYYVAAYPPFSCWSAEDVPALHRLLATENASPGETPLGIYVHIPFCAERCDYCYYRAYAATSRHRVNQYLAGLFQELALYRSTPWLANRTLSFAYFGGGTPSLLSFGQIETLFRQFQTAFPWNEAREVTFECAPKSVTRRKLALLRDAGVTRISLGIQQLDDRVLAANGRMHSVQETQRAYDAIQSYGFPKVNVDLMVGMVGETEASFFESLAKIIEMQPDSVTIYQLELPRNTPLTRMYRDGSLEASLPTWQVKRRRLKQAFASLEEAGYTIQTAYAALRDPRRHMFVYQDAQYRGADVVGIGVSSFAYLGGIHYQNADTSASYLGPLAAGRLPIQRAHVLDAEERLVREFVLQLKLGGVSIRAFQRKFGVNVAERFAAPLHDIAECGWVHVDREQESIRLTRSGLLRVDHFLSSFYLPRHRTVSYW